VQCDVSKEADIQKLVREAETRFGRVDIFFSNAGKNGMILVRLSEADVNLLSERSSKNPQHRLTINLEAQSVTDNEGFQAHFEMDPFRKYCLLNGLGDIGLTLRHETELDAYEARHDQKFWFTPRQQTHSATITKDG